MSSDMARARAFYEGVLGLTPIFEDKRLTAFGIAGRDVLLLFRRGSSTQTVDAGAAPSRSHDGSGPLHIAFAIGRMRRRRGGEA